MSNPNFMLAALTEVTILPQRETGGQRRYAQARVPRGYLALLPDVLKNNASPLPVLQETDKRFVLGSKEMYGHLFTINWPKNTPT